MTVPLNQRGCVGVCADGWAASVRAKNSSAAESLLMKCSGREPSTVSLSCTALQMLVP